MSLDPPRPAPRPVPRVSVVTVTLDDLNGLAATHASLREQTFRDFEWVVADGGSTDGTPEFLASLAEAPAWWRSGPDGGLYDAMNRGLGVASGEYLLFLNAGDRLASADTLARLVRAASAAGRPDLVYGDSVESGSDGRPLLKRARSHRTAWWGMFAQHQSMAFRREALIGLSYDTHWNGGGRLRPRPAVAEEVPGHPASRVSDLPLCTPGHLVPLRGARSARTSADSLAEHGTAARRVPPH